MLESDIASQLAALATRRVRAEAIDVTLREDGTAWIFAARYELRDTGETDELPLMLRVTGSRLRLVGATGRGIRAYDPVSVDGSIGGSTKVVLVEPTDRGWNGAEVTLYGSWKMDDEYEGSLLVLPEMLPSPVVPEIAGISALPRPQVRISELATQGLYGIGAVSAQVDTPASPHGSCTQLVVASLRSRHGGESPRHSVWNEQWDEGTLLPAGPSIPVSRHDTLVRADAWLDRVFGTTAPVRRCMVHASAYPKDYIASWSHGAAVLDLDTLPELWSDETSVIGRYVARLAAMWWGVGCRLVGQHACDIQTAIGLAVMLRLISDDPATSDLGEVMIAQSHDTPQMELAAAICRRPNEPDRMILPALTRKYWATDVQATSVLGDLAEAGVSIPEAWRKVE